MGNVYREHPTPTARFVDGAIEPHPFAAGADTVVWLALPLDEGESQVWEGIRAETVDANTIRLAGVPLFAYDIHFGDEMSVVKSAEGPLVATDIARRGHFRTFRAWLDAAQAAKLPDLVRRFGEMGCLVEGYSDHLLGIGCTIDQAPEVAKALTVAEQSGELIWESGQR